MSNLPRTPPADRRLVDQEQNAEIGVAFDVLADETRQLVLDSEEIAASRLRLSGSSQPVPQVTMDLLSSILQSFQETLLDIIDKRLSDESTINLRHGGNGMRDRFEAISSPIAQNSRHPQQNSPLASGMHGFMGLSGPIIGQEVNFVADALDSALLVRISPQIYRAIRCHHGAS